MDDQSWAWVEKFGHQWPVVVLVIAIVVYMLRRADKREAQFEQVLNQRDAMFTETLDNLATVIKDNTRVIADVDKTIAILIAQNQTMVLQQNHKGVK